MKRKIFLFCAILLMHLASLKVSNGQPPPDNLPDGVIARFSHGAAIYTVAFSADGQHIASGGDDNSVILWNVTARGKRDTFVGHNKFVTSVAFSPDGDQLASASLDGFVRLWPLSSERQRTSDKDNGNVESVAFSPNGDVLASGGGDREGFVTLWSIPQENRIDIFPAHRGVVESVAFSPDGQLLASASRDKTIKLWDVGTQYMRKTLSGHKNVVRSVAFSPDGKTLASSSRDYTIKLWDVVSEELTDTLIIQGNKYIYAESVAFSPDGKLLAAACIDYTVKLWNITNLHGRPTTLNGHYGGVTSVAFSPDGRMLASGSRDRTVLLWDLAHFGFEIPPIVLASKEPESFRDRLLENPASVNLPKESESTASEGKSPLHGQEMTPGTLGEESKPIQESTNLPHHQDTTPPDIKIFSPTEPVAHQSGEPLIVKGVIRDDNNISEVKVNNIKVALLEDGTFTTTVLLPKDENDIRVTAIDEHNNLGTHLLTLHRKDTQIDAEGPEINILSPTREIKRGVKSTIIVRAASTVVSGTATDPSGIAKVMINDTEAEINGNSFDATIQLAYGNNQINVRAMDRFNNAALKGITIYRPSPDPIVQVRRNYALLFAVDTYDYWPGLRYPRIDAVNIGRDLEDIYGFEVELIHNPTKEEILTELHKYAQKEYGPEDQLLIFFAGHGDFDTLTNMGYLVSKDTKKPEDDSFRISYFSHSYFRDFIDRMSCKHVFLVMDTCYSGTFDERLAMRGEAGDVPKPLSPADIQRKLRYTTRWYLTSGAKEQVPDNSLFARALLDALRSEGGSDNILTIKEILTYFEELSDPKPYFGEFGRNEPGSDFLFIKKME